MTNFVKVKCSELSPTLLNWTVGTFIEHKKLVPNWKNKLQDLYFLVDGSGSSEEYSPVTNFSQIENIIHKYRVSLNDIGESWVASLTSSKNREVISSSDKNPLVAICKVVVKYELESTVEIPEILF